MAPAPSSAVAAVRSALRPPPRWHAAPALAPARFYGVSSGAAEGARGPAKPPESRAADACQTPPSRGRRSRPLTLSLCGPFRPPASPSARHTARVLPLHCAPPRASSPWVTAAGCSLSRPKPLPPVVSPARPLPLPLPRGASGPRARDRAEGAHASSLSPSVCRRIAGHPPAHASGVRGHCRVTFAILPLVYPPFTVVLVPVGAALAPCGLLLRSGPRR
mmetsp:Transcript_19069/g.33101  ORF Transcript_19069/g.33101 Transcript_19069/m.33101 type:complete len:219 (-) Transcript_19069:1203-1859(-)